MGGFFMEKMMIPDNYKPIRQVGNGKTVSFSFDFPMLSENFIKVYREQDGVQELVDPSEYVWGYIPVEGEDAPVEDVAPENVITFYEAPADGVVIVIAREIPLEQTTPYKTSSGFPAVRVEDNFDKLTAITQQLTETLERCVKVEITDDQDPQELIDDVFEKLDTATEVGEQAIKTAEETKQLVEGAKATIQEETQNAISELGVASEGYIEKARIWAEGEQAEVKPLGGELSSMGAADLAYAIANAPEDTPIDASGLFAMNVVKGEKGDKGDKGEDGKDGGGVEIGDVAFAVMGVDETKNLRRYLNGQVISQAQFVSFTNKIKAAIQLTPSLATSETNWQAEVTNSPYGICGKFVIDDTLGTIRLPKYPDWSIREVGQTAVVGNGKVLGLTDGSSLLTGLTIGSDGDGSFKGRLAQAPGTYGKNLPYSGGRDTAQNNKALGITTDPTKSGMIADLINANTEDKLQGKWFIQVATGVEESVDVTREIELNNPFSLLDYKWSEYELNNASWLISNGTFHSGATYVAVYEILLKIKNGTETKDGVSVKLVSEEYSDTDFVINTADTTFRLPIKVANTPIGGIAPVVGNGSVMYFTSEQNSAQNTIRGNYGFGNSRLSVLSLGSDSQTYNGSLKLTTDTKHSGIIADLSQATNESLKLYFYVGETIQDANVIAASQVLTAIVNKANTSLSNVDSNIDYVVKSYNDGKNWYKVWKSGWIEQGGQSDATGNRTVNFLKPFKNELYTTSATAWFGAQMCYVTIGDPRNSTQLQLKPSHTSSLISIFWRACGQGA